MRMDRCLSLDGVVRTTLQTCRGMDGRGQSQVQPSGPLGHQVNTAQTHSVPSVGRQSEPSHKQKQEHAKQSFSFNLKRLQNED